MHFSSLEISRGGGGGGRVKGTARQRWRADVGQCFYSSASAEKQEFQTGPGLLLFQRVPPSHFSIHRAHQHSLSPHCPPFIVTPSSFLSFFPDLFIAAHHHHPSLFVHPHQTCRTRQCVACTLCILATAVWVSEQVSACADADLGTVHN